MIKFICEHCGTEFYRRQNKGQRFCSNKCRAAHLPNNLFDKNGHPANFIYNKDIKYCKICGKQLYYGCRTNYCNEHYHSSIEYRNKISETAKLHNNGGYRNGSGGGHKGKYDNINFDSSWELAFYIYYKEHDLFIKRCTNENVRKYIFENKEHTYIPDFITNEGIIEIKGYNTNQSEAKRIQNPDIKFLYKDDIKIYLDYVIDKYGKDFYLKFYNK